MTEQIRNGYADEVLQKIVNEIEGYEKDKLTAKAEAAGKCSALSKRIQNAKKVGKSLNIPTVPLNALLKSRILERKLNEAVGDVPPEFSEIFVDMTELLGDFADTDLGGAAVQAAKAHHEASEKVQEQEQADGAAALEEMTTH